jgi:NAD(P)-dependent dehydrogenase (short-subunit alcohol dehydrogenase family)
MITKGGLETITQHLAMEYAKDGIRVNAVALGAVSTPLSLRASSLVSRVFHSVRRSSWKSSLK